MSMTLVVGLQLVFLFSAYILVTILLPALVIGNKIKKYRFLERVLFYYMFGNFYIMTVVFVLQLLHISNRVTLIMATLIPAFLIGIKLRNRKFKPMIMGSIKTFRKIVQHTLGIKTVVYRKGKWIGKCFKKQILFIKGYIVTHKIELILIVVMFIALFLIYGRQLFKYYGYTESDIPVHLYWINEMCKNNIFAAGVYPFGFHCIVYYLHEVFGIDTYVIMCVFAFVQNVFVHLMLWMFLKLCSRSTLIPYIGMYMYLIGNYFIINTYERYYATLPQEYGMLFILPSVYFAMAFFPRRNEEIKLGNKKKDSLFCLVGFAMSFAMSLAVHFYGVMIAGLFCIGIAAGYAFFVFRPKYLVNILVTGILSVLIAVLPMAIAFVTGTPLQGSLGWGMNVISGSSASDVLEDEEETTDNSGNTDKNTVQTEQSGTADKELQNILSGQSMDVEVDNEKEQMQKELGVKEKLQIVFQKVSVKISDIWENISWQLESRIFYRLDSVGTSLTLILIIASFFVALLLMGIKKVFAGAALLSTAIYMVIMSLLLSAKEIGFPVLMDANRCSIYYAYSFPVLLVLFLDGSLYLILSLIRKTKWMDKISCACILIFIFNMVSTDRIKEINYKDTLVSNEAITCMYRILKDEEDFTWTICSANDERQMILEKGYHYEIFDFLKSMEYVGTDARMEIPTKNVYFFIEKKPIPYTVYYQGSGQSVSKRGAVRRLPVSGLVGYEGENRWIYMSRMYYWAQEFLKLYPNEMTVYYETENFVCYKIKQNTYHLYNFAIDYGYNTRRAEIEV